MVQRILEEEVTELLGREKSERKTVVDPAPGYRNGYGKALRLVAKETAQRRPGPRPRRHCVASTMLRTMPHAQRRPGPRPQRHSLGGGRMNSSRLKPRDSQPVADVINTQTTR